MLARERAARLVGIIVLFTSKHVLQFAAVILPTEVSEVSVTEGIAIYRLSKVNEADRFVGKSVRQSDCIAEAVRSAIPCGCCCNAEVI